MVCLRNSCLTISWFVFSFFHFEFSTWYSSLWNEFILETWFLQYYTLTIRPYTLNFAFEKLRIEIFSFDLIFELVICHSEGLLQNWILIIFIVRIYDFTVTFCVIFTLSINRPSKDYLGDLISSIHMYLVPIKKNNTTKKPKHYQFQHADWRGQHRSNTRRQGTRWNLHWNTVRDWEVPIEPHKTNWVTSKITHDAIAALQRQGRRQDRADDIHKSTTTTTTETLYGGLW